jgi:hypothetical protein
MGSPGKNKAEKKFSYWEKVFPIWENFFFRNNLKNAKIRTYLVTISVNGVEVRVYKRIVLPNCVLA